VNSLGLKLVNIFTLTGMAILSSCGEVKVVKKDELISAVNPMDEVVKVIIDKTSEIPMNCLNIKEPVFQSGVSVSDVERDVFNRAVIAHLL